MNVERFDWEGHAFDQVDGMGNVPDVAEVAARGLVAFVRPSTFLALCPRESLDPSGILRALRGGKPVSMGFLRLDVSGAAPEVVAHEGRHRMAALRAISGDVPFPVAFLFANGLRARHVDADVLAALRDGIVAQSDGTRPGRLVDGPVFDRAVLGGRMLHEADLASGPVGPGIR